MTGVAVVIVLVAMAASWLLRSLMLRTLRSRHPGEFEALGNPSDRALRSLLPRHQETQLAFWRYLWGGKVFRLGDPLVSGLAWAAMAADVALVAGLAMLVWSAGAAN